jgi:hypothetical protein
MNQLAFLTSTCTNSEFKKLLEENGNIYVVATFLHVVFAVLIQAQYVLVHKLEP